MEGRFDVVLLKRDRIVFICKSHGLSRAMERCGVAPILGGRSCVCLVRQPFKDDETLSEQAPFS